LRVSEDSGHNPATNHELANAARNTDAEFSRGSTHNPSWRVGLRSVGRANIKARRASEDSGHNPATNHELANAA
jgi:hypothetical protein